MPVTRPIRQNINDVAVLWDSFLSRSKVHKIYQMAFAQSFIDLIASPHNVSILPSVDVINVRSQENESRNIVTVTI